MPIDMVQKKKTSLIVYSNNIPSRRGGGCCSSRVWQIVDSPSRRGVEGESFLICYEYGSIVSFKLIM
jgi:hypothetical protein